MIQKILSLFILSVMMKKANAQFDSTHLAEKNKEIVFASDTQAPMWVETLWLKANNNREATKSIFNHIIHKNPQSVFLLGDVVSLGYSNKQWKPIDEKLEKLRHNGVKVYAVLGNHEVMGQSNKGQQKFQQRFPDHNKTGYVQVIDSIAVIMLNSNFNQLSDLENREQVNWYKNTLDKLDADSSVQFIITGCHHSPYTNSKIVGCSKPVQEKFVPHYLHSAKSRLFLSGHCHNFEHYKIQGKDFIVIGGGGGLHQPLKTGDGSLPDLSIDYKPMFHYLTVKLVNNELNVQSIALEADKNSFKDGFTFNIAHEKPETLAKNN